MLNLISKIAVQNVSSPSSIAIMTNIMEGVDGSSTFGLTSEAQTVQVADNQTQQFAHEFTLDIRVLDEDSNSAVIDGIIAGDGLALISGYGPDGFFIWNEPVRLVRNKVFDNILATAVTATIRCTPGFRGSPRSRAVHASRNLISVYDVSTLNSTTINAQRIFFPFPGIDLFATSGSGGISIVAYDASNTLIAEEPLDLTLPFGTVYVGLGGTYTLPMVTLNGADSNFIL